MGTNLRQAVSAALVQRGFERSGRMHRRRVDASFCEVVDTGPLGTRADIAPFVGLRHDEVESLFTTLLAVPEDAWVATVGGNVGYVLGRDYMSWAGHESEQTPMGCIASALDRYSAVRSLETLRDAWAIGGLEDPGRQYRQVCIAVLLGDPARIDECLSEAREAYCTRQDEVCEQFRGFERRLLARREGRG